MSTFLNRTLPSSNVAEAFRQFDLQAKAFSHSFGEWNVTIMQVPENSDIYSDPYYKYRLPPDMWPRE
jgi:hypothetical protein